MKEVIALAMDGGCMLGSFGFGVLRHLYKVGIFPGNFQIFAGTSAGYFDLLYCLSGQWEEGYRMWTKRLVNGFIKRGLIPNFDLYFLEKVLKHSEDALLLERIRGMEQRIWLPVSNLITGDPDFYCVNTHHDPFELMLAGCRMPWDKRQFSINGSLVCDGGLVCQPPVGFAKQMGATEIWVVSPHPIGYRISPLMRKLAAPILGRCEISRRLIRDSAVRENLLRRELEGRKEVQIICPKTTLPIDWRCTDGNAVAHTIALGEEAAKDFLLRRAAL